MTMKQNIPTVHKMTSTLLESEVERFLKKGGKIKKIKMGETGEDRKPLNRKHINTSGFKKRNKKKGN
ncbi:hypothetical protein ACU6U9_02565 [Pseudomonas sp. HK3]|jgi:hypothetical protein